MPIEPLVMSRFLNEFVSGVYATKLYFRVLFYAGAAVSIV